MNKVLYFLFFSAWLQLSDASQAEPMDLVKTLKGHEGGITSLSMGPKNYLISGSKDQSMVSWPIDKGGAKSTRFPFEGEPIVAAAQNGDVAIGLKNRGNSHVYWSHNVNNEKKSQNLLIGSHGGDVTGIAFNPINNDELVSSSWDGTVRLWQKGRPHAPKYLNGHRGFVWSVTFSPDGNFIASGGGDDKTIILWDAKTGKEIGRLEGHNDKIDTLEFNPKNSNQLASSSWDRTVRLWDIKQRKQTGKVDENNYSKSMAFSPDGKLIALGAQDGTLRFWSTEKKQFVGEPIKVHEGPISSIVFFDDGAKIVTASSDEKDIKVWQLNNGPQSLKTLTIDFIKNNGLDVTNLPPLLLK